MKSKNCFKYLFISSTRLKLINVFFYFPQEIFFVRQLVRLVDEEINSVRRELENLTNAGIIIPDRRGHRLFYGTNPKSPIFHNLMLIAHQSTGLGASLSSRNEKIGNIKYLLYSFNFAYKTVHSSDDIDLIIIGDVSYKEIESLIKDEEALIGREINYMIMDKNEFNLRRQKRDQFIVDFFLSAPLVIIGNPKEINGQ
jgi:hypothetical protein